MNKFIGIILGVALFFPCDIASWAQYVNHYPTEVIIVEGDDYIIGNRSINSIYRVADKAVLSCSSTGIVKARKPGKTSISVLNSNQENRIEVMVLPKRRVRMTGDFPILAWYSLQEDVSRSRFLELAEAGFNLSFSYATDSIVPQMQRAIESAQGTGIRLVIPFRGQWVDVGPIVNQFKDSDELWGWYIIDEPSIGQLSDTKAFINKIRAYDPNHPYYVNLLPIYAPQSLLGDKTYDGYLKECIETLSLPFLSFDHYPFTNQGLRKDFFKNLRVVSSIANSYSIPFWAFACSVKYSGSVPTPELRHMKLEVFSALAFGAQGIEYFTYTTPRKEHGGDHFSNAPIGKDKKQSMTYSYVKKVNARVRSMEPYFSDAEPVFVGSVGNGLLEGVDVYKDYWLPPEIESISSSQTSLVSWLVNNRSSIIVVVNTDLYRSSTIRIGFKKDVKKLSDDGQLVSASELELLPPCEMAIYVLN